MEEKTEKKFSLKSLFFNETDGNSETKKPETKPVQTTQVVSPPPPTMPVTSTVGVVNKETYSTLMKILEERNLPGPDYLELKKAADAMATVITDENVRYISAYSVLKASNPTLTKTQVISSIDEYIKYIESERSVAKDELGKLYEKEVGTRQKDIQSKVDLITLNKQKIEELNTEILKLSQEINTVNGEMLTKQTDIEIQEKNFNVTVDTIVTNLNTDKTKLNTLITE